MVITVGLWVSVVWTHRLLSKKETSEKGAQSPLLIITNEGCWEGQLHSCCKGCYLAFCDSVSRSMNDDNMPKVERDCTHRLEITGITHWDRDGDSIIAVEMHLVVLAAVSFRTLRLASTCLATNCICTQLHMWTLRAAHNLFKSIHRRPLRLSSISKCVFL